MGCWNETCGFSNLPITNGMPVRAMFIKRVKESRYKGAALFYAFDLFHPATIMIKSTYNDYGWLNVSAEEIVPLIANVENMGLDISFGDAKDGFRPDDLPEDTYLLMIREDVYQMLRDIPLDNWGDKPKTVGEYVDRLRVDYAQLANEIRTELANNTEKMGIWSFTIRDRMDRMFVRSEMARWQEFFLPNRGIDVPPENVDELVDILQIFSAMNALRKNLVPTIGGGSQDYNDGGYMVIANFMKNAMDERRKEYDWEDEEET